MSGAYSPDAIQACYDTVKAAVPSAQLGGIYGNKPGYHNCRNQLPGSDYSVQQSYDQGGDGWAAGALDITLQPAEMKKFTQRLIDATRAGEGDGGRMRAVREFFGTVDGYTVTGMDVPGRYWVSSDDSHLWHIHLSGRRESANNAAAWADVAAVMLGGTAPPPSGGDDDMGTFETVSNSARQAMGTDWRTIGIAEGSQSWLHGPCTFQAQANFSAEGVAIGSAIKFRWIAVDVRTSDGWTKSDPANTWPTIEVGGTSGGLAGSVLQLGQIGNPASGYQRRLRLQACADQSSGVTLTYIRASSFRQ